VADLLLFRATAIAERRLYYFGRILTAIPEMQRVRQIAIPSHVRDPIYVLVNQQPHEESEVKLKLYVQVQPYE
jgi:hypothetical protein